MEEPKSPENVLDSNVDHGFLHSRDEFPRFECKDSVKSENLLDVLKCRLIKWTIDGVDMVFKDQKSLKSNRFASGLGKQSFLSDNQNGSGWNTTSQSCQDCAESTYQAKRDKASSTMQEIERACSNCDDRQVDLRRDQFDATSEWDNEHAHVPSGSYYDHFPFNFLPFRPLLLIKFIGFQLNLLVRIFTFPIWLSYFPFMFMLFPFQTLRHIRGYMMRKLFGRWDVTYMNVTSSVTECVNAQKSVVVRVGRAIFSVIYVLCMLLALLASGRFIPYNHKLQLTVSLTVPESEYNRKLGDFQVRVEFLSGNGKITACSSYPCMLRFKSQPIRFVETFLKSAPLIAGFQSESQVLNIKMNKFTEGLEPTACLKMTLEPRAEYQHGAGIPQVYAASVALESELPKLKKIIWYWRRTLFVWASIMSFLTELVFILAFCRPMIVQGTGKPRIGSTAWDSHSNTIFRNKRT
ncbi:seipin-3-like [Juglans regia]|uniref:Seipin-3-like n=1 Tax=Juglans regia TaxID=51240 RepID=A0A6P9F521_JUGRE|nr:seipin-3-like [Juglans regia]